MVEFAGWQMPVQYRGVIDEHRAVRTAAGLFDVSHMGEIRVAGEGAEAFLQRLTPNDVAKLAPGRAHYSALLTPEGTFVDDLLVYRLAADEFLVVVNAGNAAGDFAWVGERHLEEDGAAVIEDVSDRYALLALQGPRAAEILQPLTATPLAEIKYYRFAQGEVADWRAMISRTGYTGEDGFELYLAPEDAPAVWDAAARSGRPGRPRAGRPGRARHAPARGRHGALRPRDRPHHDALGGRARLDREARQGATSSAATRSSPRAPGARRVAWWDSRSTGRGIARDGHRVLAGGRDVGHVTSGTFSPTFEKALGLAYVEAALAEPGAAARDRRPRQAGPGEGRTVPLLQEGSLSRPRAPSTAPGGDEACIRPSTATRATTSGCGVEDDVCVLGITDFAQTRAGRGGVRRAARGRARWSTPATSSARSSR